MQQDLTDSKKAVETHYGAGAVAPQVRVTAV